MLVYAAFPHQQVGCAAVLWKQSEVGGSLVLVLRQNHEKAETPDHLRRFLIGNQSSL
ncbi:hypothetical protein SynA1840_01836 [Synechococcus sp. A18-40]|nr:hypothetical protein SynA1840_01836 [Synechococcus sp. A18-40]